MNKTKKEILEDLSQEIELSDLKENDRISPLELLKCFISEDSQEDLYDFLVKDSDNPLNK